tara:strand:+ start:190 stop:726 length:537 start_codon:yes stop_codon:yes gene_type:complete
MLLHELFATEIKTANRPSAGAMGSALKSLGQGIIGLAGLSPTKKGAAVEDLAEKWDKHFAKLVQKDSTARQRYGVEFQKWVKDNYNINNVSSKIDVKQVVADGKPNKKYIYKVFNTIFDQAQKEKKSNPGYGGDSSKGTEKGALGTGSDGKTYVWAGNVWVTQDTNAVRRKSVTVTPS